MAMNPTAGTVSAIRTLDDGKRVEFDLELGGISEQIWFTCEQGLLKGTSEAAFAAMLLPTMQHGSELVVPGILSSDFLARQQAAMQMYSCWWPEFQQIQTRPESVVVATPSPEPRVATFFSCGVDSFYTLLKHRDEITDLVMIHGFDYEADKVELRAQLSRAVHAVAREMGKDVIEIYTNLAAVQKKWVGWPRVYGSTLATIGHLLSSRVRQIFVPAGVSYDQLRPCPVHPLVDPLWSSEALAFRHDGAEASRLEKVESFIEDPLARENLHVCWYSTGDLYNCGVCDKCLRTMVSLEAFGVLEHFKTFKEPLTPAKATRMRVLPYHRCFHEENLSLLEARGVRPDLQRALRRAIRRPQWLWRWQDRFRHPHRVINTVLSRGRKLFTHKGDICRM